MSCPCCVTPPPGPLCPCNCSGSGFDYCDFAEAIDFSVPSTCPAGFWPFQYDVPCFNLVFADFDDVLLYFGTTSQGYPFSLQWLKDDAVGLYLNETCSFAIQACQKVRATTSRCMRDGECICNNYSTTVSNDWWVWVFNCEQEAWVDITDDILTENRDVAFQPGPVFGPANNCVDCEFENGNPPTPPPDPGPCDYDRTTGECENITGNFP